MKEFTGNPFWGLGALHDTAVTLAPQPTGTPQLATAWLARRMADGRLPRRVHIVGGPGSGKTSLARRLAQDLHVPMYELDRIAFEGLEYTWRPLEVRLAEVNDIAAESSWVTEGMWLGWTEPILAQADVVVWLDCVPWYTAFRRILLRFAKGGLQEAKRQPGLRKISRVHDYQRNLRLLSILMHVSWQYYNGQGLVEPCADKGPMTRLVTETYLARFDHKLVRCRTTQEVELLVSAICAES